MIIAHRDILDMKDSIPSSPTHSCSDLKCIPGICVYCQHPNYRCSSLEGTCRATNNEDNLHSKDMIRYQIMAATRQWILLSALSHTIGFRRLRKRRGRLTGTATGGSSETGSIICYATYDSCVSCVLLSVCKKHAGL